MALLLNLAVLFLGFYECSGHREPRDVIELDHRFLENRKEGSWLVEFYAPWCGHCRKLEPVYKEVAVALRSTPIIVGKVDGTKFPSVASEYNVRGFPSIIFVKGNKVYTHHGDRTKASLVEFAKRAQGPVLREITSVGKFNEARGEHGDDVFFVYVGDQDPKGELMIIYKNVAEIHAIHSYFYIAEERSLPQDVTVEFPPAVVVFKDGKQYVYDGGDVELEDWVNNERYNIFPLVAGGGINEMAESGKLLVIVAVDGTEKSLKNDRIRDVARKLAVDGREIYHSAFQFMYMGDLDTVWSITMSNVESPTILVLDTKSHLYYLPLNTDVSQMTTDSLAQFLQDVKEGKVAALGGTGIKERLKRVGYDIVTTVIGVWQHSRLMFFIMFILPGGVISLVCYTLCCATWEEEEFNEDDEEEEEEEEVLAEEVFPETVREEHEIDNDQLRRRQKIE